MVLMGAAVLACASAEAQTNSYSVTNIVTNTQDAKLVNPWGISRSANKTVAENQWWVADNATGVSTLYDANGTIVGLDGDLDSAGQRHWTRAVRLELPPST